MIKSLRDRALCLQFIRRHADRLGLDPQRVVLMGASAGAGTSLWIGTTDDLADPGSADPVLRQSTRVSGVVLLETQATYDIGRWSIDVFPDLGISVLEGAALLGLEGRLLSFYGISELADFDSPEILEYRRRVDMIELLSSDDPPDLRAQPESTRRTSRPRQRPFSPCQPCIGHREPRARGRVRKRTLRSRTRHRRSRWGG